MIVLSDFFKLLASGEFSNIALSRQSNNTIAESEYEKLLGHIQLGLIDLHKRFRFMEEQLTLHVTTTNEKYFLTADRMVLEENLSDEQYIELASDQDGYINIVKVLAVYDEDDEEMDMNNRFCTPAVREIQTGVLMVTGLEADATWTVTYQAYPTKIKLDKNFDVDETMLMVPDGAIDALLRHGADEKNINVYKVPGAFEIPLTAKKLALTKNYDAIICLGVVIRGGTPHFDYIAAEVSKGIAAVGLETEMPIIFGVLTTDTIEQAIERSGSKAGNKGWDAANAAIEMVNLCKQM